MKNDINNTNEKDFILNDNDDYVNEKLVFLLKDKGYPLKELTFNDKIRDFNYNENHVVEEKEYKKIWYIPTIFQVSKWIREKGYKVETGPYWIKKKMYWQFSVTEGIGTNNIITGYSKTDGEFKKSNEAFNAAFEYILNKI